MATKILTGESMTIQDLREMKKMFCKKGKRPLLVDSMNTVKFIAEMGENLRKGAGNGTEPR